MEEICASKALSWYRELDKDFRCLKTGGQCEAILTLAPRLLQWSLDPPANEAAAEMFKLDAGQEQAYAHAIFSRLMDSFKNGSNMIRLCILKVLLFVYNGHKKSARTSLKSLLSNERISDHVEMLKKVKSVVRSTDLTARCIGLRVLGCLSQLDCDSSDLHWLVLQSISSKLEEEVDAAIFAAGCFCENSETFATICCENFKQALANLEVPTRLHVEGIRLFSKMWLSSRIAADIHKFGSGILSKRPSEEIVKTTLTSLSNLVTKVKSLLPTHVHLLLKYVHPDHPVSVQLLSLVLLTRMLPRAVFFLKPGQEDLLPLFTVIRDSNSSPALRRQALCVFEKVTSVYNMKDSRELISLGELIAEDGDWSVSIQAIRLLVELICKFEQSNRQAGDILTKVTSLLSIGVTTCPGDDGASECYRCILRLVTHTKNACYLLVEFLFQRLQRIIVREEDISGDTVMSDVETGDLSKLPRLCRALLICGTHLNLDDPMINVICQRFNQVTGLLSSTDGFDEVYVNLVPAFLNVRLMGDTDTAVTGDKLLQSPSLWDACKLAKKACVFGQWDISERIYKSICVEVISETCHFWLKALASLSSAENLILSRTEKSAIAETSCQSCRLLEASLKTMEAGVQLDKPFEFQSRLIRLRIRLLQLMMECRVVCQSVIQCQRLHDKDVLTKRLLSYRETAQGIVSGFQTLAEDFYIMTISFIGIDNNSLQVLYARMFQASFLAFCTALAFLPLVGSCYDHSKKPSSIFSKRNVFEEVTGFSQRRPTLQQFYVLLRRIAIGNLSYRRDVHWVKTQPTSQLVRSVWQHLMQVISIDADGTMWMQEKGIPFLNQVINQAFLERYLLPKYFFKIRPRVQVEVFTSATYGKERSEYITVSEGCALSLKLGLMITNMPAGFELRKLSCMLVVSGSMEYDQHFTDGDLKELDLLKWLAFRNNLSTNAAAIFSLTLEGQQRQAFYSCTLDTSNLPRGVYELSCFCVSTDKSGLRWMPRGPSCMPKLKVA